VEIDQHWRWARTRIAIEVERQRDIGDAKIGDVLDLLGTSVFLDSGGLRR
jgi:hypothetical protein